MACKEEEFLQLSGIQHFLFCRRQWALIHLEQQWTENYRTIDGQLMHRRAHDAQQRERRGDLLTVRGMNIHSFRLGLSGQCDVVEFHRCEKGVPLSGVEGLWLPCPVEYKRGRAKAGEEDEAQLCAQAMCLEEMLCCDIPEGALYYGETRRRQAVRLTVELRSIVEQAAKEMHQLFKRGSTPKVKRRKGCSACSLKELCLPQLMQHRSVAAYLQQSMEDMT